MFDSLAFVAIFLCSVAILSFAQVPHDYKVIKEGEALAAFWQTYGREKFRVLSEVARSVLGAPPSAAVLEPDFDDAWWLVNHPPRGSLGPAYAEMIMFLRGVYEYIPGVIPILSDEQAEEAIPYRFKDPTVRKELAQLFVVGDDDEASGLVLADSDDERELEREKR